jgi:adenylate cyclase
MTSKSFWITLFSLGCLGIYLFVSAPPPLDDQKTRHSTIPVEQMFALLQAENAAARLIWTREIVGEGKKVDLKFDEHWRDADLEAGPLPALFLRETAKSMEKSPVRLSLFLGSDYPISPDNRFEGLQQEKFQALRQSRQAQFFYVPDTGLHTGMFADIAVAAPCIECHNKHEQSPKHDWQLNDVMGAATWMYPAPEVSLEEMLKAIMVLHQGIQDAYAAYLEKVKTFAHPPVIGEHWPRDGYYLPSLEVFMQAFLQHTAQHTLPALGALSNSRKNNKLKESVHDMVE